MRFGRLQDDFQIGPSRAAQRAAQQAAWQEAKDGFIKNLGLSEAQAIQRANAQFPAAAKPVPSAAAAQKQLTKIQKQWQQYVAAGGGSQRYTQTNLQQKQRLASSLYDKYRGTENPATGKDYTDQEARQRAEIDAGLQRDPSKPLTVFDPYGRLQPVQPVERYSMDQLYRDTVRYQQQVASQQQQRLPVASTSSPAAHVTEERAFEEYIRCLGRQDLQAVMAQLQQYRQTLERTPASADRNTQLSRVKMKISKANIQWARPAPCPGGSVIAPQTAALTDSYSSCLDLQRRGAKIACPGQGQPTTQITPSSGITVSTMPSAGETGIMGEQVVVNAPLLDLYGEYMAKGLERETEAMRAESERLMRELEQVEAYAPYVSPVPPQTAAQAEGDEALFSIGLPTVEDVPFKDQDLETAVAAEQASAGESGGPVAMSATAEALGGETNWWVVAAIGAVLLGFAAKAKKRGAKRAGRKRR